MNISTIASKVLAIKNMCVCIYALVIWCKSSLFFKQKKSDFMYLIIIWVITVLLNFVCFENLSLVGITYNLKL